MSISKLLTRSTARAVSTSTSAQLTKAAGDISSVFPSLRPDYKPEPLPPRFKDLKERIFRRNEDALKKSWERLLPSLEEEVDKIKAKKSGVRMITIDEYLKTNGTRSSLLWITLTLFPVMCLRRSWRRSVIADLSLSEMWCRGKKHGLGRRE